MAATPPLASATRNSQCVADMSQGGCGSLLEAPKGESSRVLKAPELLPVPYTQRLELPVAAPGRGGDAWEADGDGAPTVVASSRGAVKSAGNPAAGDGMENLKQQVCMLMAVATQTPPRWGI